MPSLSSMRQIDPEVFRPLGEKVAAPAPAPVKKPDHTTYKPINPNVQIGPDGKMSTNTPRPKWGMRGELFEEVKVNTQVLALRRAGKSHLKEMLKELGFDYEKAMKGEVQEGWQERIYQVPGSLVGTTTGRLVGCHGNLTEITKGNWPKSPEEMDSLITGNTAHLAAERRNDVHDSKYFDPEKVLKYDTNPNLYEYASTPLLVGDVCLVLNVIGSGEGLDRMEALVGKFVTVTQTRGKPYKNSVFHENGIPCGKDGECEAAGWSWIRSNLQLLRRA